MWTDFKPGAQPGLLDWYTVTCGVVVLVAIANHGARYLILRSSGLVHHRARGLAKGMTRLNAKWTRCTMRALSKVISFGSAHCNFRDQRRPLIAAARKRAVAGRVPGRELRRA